jgi:hypothetical protein
MAWMLMGAASPSVPMKRLGFFLDVSFIRSNASALVAHRSSVVHDPFWFDRSIQNGNLPSARRTTTYLVMAKNIAA